MRFINRRKLLVGLAVVGLAVPAMPAVSGASESDLGVLETFTMSPNIAVVESVALPGGAVALRTAGGTTVIGPSDLELVVADGQGAVAVSDPKRGVGDFSTGWTDTVMQAFLDRAAGNTLAAAAAAVEPLRQAAVSTTGPVDELENGVCAEGGNVKVFGRSCIKRQSGNDNGTDAYIGDAGFTYARVEQDPNLLGSVRLRSVKHQHDYGKSDAQLIVDFNPKSVVYPGSCGNLTMGVSGFGVNVGYTQVVCPDQLVPILRGLGQEQLHTTWYGNTGGPVHSEQADIVKHKSGVPSKVVFSFVINYRYQCNWNPVVCAALA